MFRVRVGNRSGTCRVNRDKQRGRVVVSADGAGVVSHAGVGLLREMAQGTGLVDGITQALIGTYRGVPVHAPGRVFTDLAAAVADGADAISGIAVLRDRDDLHGPVASMPTTWRVLDRIDADRLNGVRQARAAARARAWEAGAGPDLHGELRLDFDATSTVAHSEKENAAATWKRTFGFYPLLCFLDRPDIAGGEALAGLLRPGNAGSNTATDHITVLELALASLPEHARPTPGPEPGTWAGPRVLARSDSAGATHAFAQACVDRGVGFSFGFPVDARIQRIVDLIPDSCWHPALQTDRGDADDVREGAWVAEATGTIDLATWPDGSRLILRKEHPHPGAQLTFTVEGSEGVGVEVVHDQHDLLGVGVVHGEQVVDLGGPVGPGAPVSGGHAPTTGQRLDPHEDRAGAVPDVLVVLLAVPARCGRERVTGMGQQLVGLLIHAHHRCGRVVRAGPLTSRTSSIRAANSPLAFAGIVHCFFR